MTTHCRTQQYLISFELHFPWLLSWLNVLGTFLAFYEATFSLLVQEKESIDMGLHISMLEVGAP